MSTDTRGLTDRLSRHPVAAGLTSGLLLWSAFPPVEWSWLGWLALVPLFWLAIQTGPRLRLYLGAWAGGLVFWLLSVQWVRLTDPTAWLAWLAMAIIFSFWWPIFLALTRLAVFRLAIPLMMAAPILWVGMEYVRAHFLSGFPWYYLGHSQYRFLTLIQIADTTSALGVSFLIALVNAWMVDMLSLPLLSRTAKGTRLTARQTVRLWTVALLLGGTLIYGAFRLSTAQFRAGPRLALLADQLRAAVQEGSRSAPDPREDPASDPARVAVEPRPDLIVWPETAYPYGYVSIEPQTPALDAGRAGRSDQRSDHGGRLAREEGEDRRAPARADRRRGTPMLVGSLYYDHHAASFNKYNSAILFEPMIRTVRAYHKIHLVPFGEYIPFLETMPWLTVFTPYRNGYVPTLNFGHEPLTLPLGPYRMAVAHLLRGYGPARDSPLLPRVGRRPRAGHGGQSLERRLVSRLVRAGHAPGRERLPDDRAPRSAGPGRQHRPLRSDRRQRRDPRHSSPPHRGRPLRDRAAR